MITHGHRPGDVWGYSLCAVQVFVDLIQTRKREELHALTVAVRHTQGTDAKVFREFLRNLLGDE